MVVKGYRSFYFLFQSFSFWYFPLFYLLDSSINNIKTSFVVVKAEEKAPPKAPPKGWKIPTQSLEALYRTGAELMEIGASNDDVQQSSSSCQSPSTSNADPQTTLQDLYRTGEELIRSGH